MLTKRTDRFGFRAFDGVATVHSDCAFILWSTYFHIGCGSLGYPKSTTKTPSTVPAPGKSRDTWISAVFPVLERQILFSPLEQE